MADTIYAGTVGLELRLTLLEDGAPHDPTAATLRRITLRPPRGEAIVREGADVGIGADVQGRPCLTYSTREGELERAGWYEVAGYLEDGAGKWPAEPVGFRVEAWP